MCVYHYEIRNMIFTLQNKFHIPKYEAVLYYFLPDLLLLLNFFTLYMLCRRRQQFTSPCVNNGNKVEMHVSDVNSNRKQRQLTIMLVTVSLSFYLFTAPTIYSLIGLRTLPDKPSLGDYKFDSVFMVIAMILHQLNNAVSEYSIK